jgi:hypothetical protein
MAKPEQLFDKRLYERFLRRGELSGKDFDAHLAGLTDNEANAENIADLIYKADSVAETAASAASSAPAPVASDDATAQDAPSA